MSSRDWSKNVKADNEARDIDPRDGGDVVIPIPHDVASPRAMRWIVGLTAGIALAIWLVTASMLLLHADQYRDELASSLSDSNGSLAEFIAAWAGDLEGTVDLIAGRPDVVYAVERIVEAGSMEPSMVTGLTELLGPLAAEGEGVAIATPDGTIIAHTSDASLYSDPALEAVARGEPGPAFSVLPADPADAPGSGPIPGGVRVWSPVGGVAAPVGWLGIEVDVGPLARMLRSAAATTDSREVYVFDDEGRLLTPSRFESDLAALGLTAPGETSIGLLVIDPGRDLSEVPLVEVGDPVGPYTLMAESALQGETGVNVDGYRDYRGVVVVGAWRWIDELGIGVATEVDRAEAFAPYSRTSMVWSVGAAILSVLVVVLSFAFAVTDRRLRRTSRDLLRLTEHLDGEVRRRTADLEASQARAQAEAAARAELVAAVSHELRTPLTSVIGFARLLEERADELDASTRVFVELLLQGGEEMADLVEDLLTSVRLSTESLDIETDVVDLAEAGRTVVSVWDPVERGRIDAEADPLEAVGDPVRIRQIIRNLVSNATRHGGPRVTVRTEEIGDRALVVVADDGPEIAIDIRENMFEIYSHAPSVEGLAPSLGIGLSLCRHLAAAMGGSIWFERVDGWNRFVLDLPVHVDQRVETAA